MASGACGRGLERNRNGHAAGGFDELDLDVRDDIAAPSLASAARGPEQVFAEERAEEVDNALAGLCVAAPVGS